MSLQDLSAYVNDQSYSIRSRSVMKKWRYYNEKQSVQTTSWHHRNWKVDLECSTMNCPGFEREINVCNLVVVASGVDGQRPEWGVISLWLFLLIRTCGLPGGFCNYLILFDDRSMLLCWCFAMFIGFVLWCAVRLWQLCWGKQIELRVQVSPEEGIKW